VSIYQHNRYFLDSDQAADTGTVSLHKFCQRKIIVFVTEIVMVYTQEG
jgi:hypothetical protein